MAAFEALWVLFILSTYMLRVVESAGNNPHHGVVDIEDNEFAEFEDFDEATDSVASQQQESDGRSPGQPPNQEDKRPDDEDLRAEKRREEDDDLEQGKVEDEEPEDEFAHLQDEEEFENFEQTKSPQGKRDTSESKQQDGKLNPLKFTDVPAHLRNNWSNYQVELLMMFGLGVYLLNYIYGKTKNQTLAQAWFDAHKDLLQQQFAVVGDDGTSKEVQQDVLVKETDSTFVVWCSGRSGCNGMLVKLQMLKRQDIVSVMSLIMRPKHDQITIRVELEADEMDTYVFAVGQKKSLAKLAKDMTDLTMYTTEKKNADKQGLPSNFTILSEIAEATANMLDPKVLAAINKYDDCVDYFHFSDQYSGAKPPEGETQSKLPDTTRVLYFCFNIPGKLSAGERHVEYTRPLMQLVFHYMEKVRRFRLSREGKAKADKNRQLAAESFLKSTHLQRQEAAQLKREEKVKERKERLMNEEDPDKQKRLEKLEQKREVKKKQPKMKQLKVKAM